MNKVQPLMTLKEINNIKKKLKSSNSQYSERNYLLFLIGINTGLRAGDLTSLTIDDVKKIQFEITEQKTNKKILVFLENIKDEIFNYINNNSNYYYLFHSRNGGHIGRNQAFEILKRKYNISPHVMRKTYSTHFLIKLLKLDIKDIKIDPDIAIEYIQKILNHSNRSETLRYFNTNEKDFEKALKEFKL